MKEALIFALAIERGVKPEALKKWRQRRHVPYKHRLPLVIEAAKRGVILRDADFSVGASRRRAA